MKSMFYTHFKGFAGKKMTLQDCSYKVMIFIKSLPLILISGCAL